MTNRPRRRTRVSLAAVSAALVVALAVSCSSSGHSSSSGPTGPTGSPAGTAEGGCARAGLPETVAYEQLDGVDPNLTSLDVHAPSPACGAPVVVWVHGGGYVRGDKANQLADKVDLFTAQGWILVSVNYRLSDPAAAHPARFPDHYDDVAAAVAWVHDHISDYGGDPGRLALLGHSAGADIVSNVATDPAHLAGRGLGLDVITCAGPLDTEGFDKVRATAADPDGEDAMWQNALGNQPDYATATSATRLVRPGIGIPPMIGVVRGTPLRQSIETDFLRTLSDAGIPATTIDARSLTHEQVNTSIGHPGDTVVTPPLLRFLDGCFA